MNSDYNYHKFRDDLNETSETNEKRFSVREAFSFLVDSSFLHTIVDKLVILLFLPFFFLPFIKDFLHYITLFGSS